MSWIRLSDLFLKQDNQDSTPVAIKNIFDEIDEKADAIRAKGGKIYDCGLLDPAKSVGIPAFIYKNIEKYIEDGNAAGKMGYPGSRGSQSFIDAAANYLERNFDITLNRQNENHIGDESKRSENHIGDESKRSENHIGDESKRSEINITNGSKTDEFIFARTIINPGDLVICPTPAYPAFRQGALFAHGVPFFVPLLEENDYLIDFNMQIPDEIAEKAKLIWINYPNSPTGRTAPLWWLENLVEWASKHKIIIASDEAYIDFWNVDLDLENNDLDDNGLDDNNIYDHSLRSDLSENDAKNGDIPENLIDNARENILVNNNRHHSSSNYDSDKTKSQHNYKEIPDPHRNYYSGDNPAVDSHGNVHHDRYLAETQSEDKTPRISNLKIQHQDMQHQDMQHQDMSVESRSLQNTCLKHPRTYSILNVTKKNVIAFFSLSKRSNMSSFRIGFAAGDPILIDALYSLKNMHDDGVPQFIQKMAENALNDDAHVNDSRLRYSICRKIWSREFDLLSIRIDSARISNLNNAREEMTEIKSEMSVAMKNYEDEQNHQNRNDESDKHESEKHENEILEDEKNHTKNHKKIDHDANYVNLDSHRRNSSRAYPDDTSHGHSNYSADYSANRIYSNILNRISSHISNDSHISNKISSNILNKTYNDTLNDTFDDTSKIHIHINTNIDTNIPSHSDSVVANSMITEYTRECLDRNNDRSHDKGHSQGLGDYRSKSGNLLSRPGIAASPDNLQKSQQFGGLFLWQRAPESMTGSEFADFLLEASIITMPGSAFDPLCNHHVRIALSADLEFIQELAEKLRTM